MKRYAARIDANQPEIVAALRAAGASVRPLHTVGGGFPDLIAGIRGVNILIEVKDGDKPPSARKLTADEKQFHETWKGQVVVCNSVAEALAACGIEYRGDVE